VRLPISPLSRNYHLNTEFRYFDKNRAFGKADLLCDGWIRNSQENGTEEKRIPEVMMDILRQEDGIWRQLCHAGMESSRQDVESHLPIYLEAEIASESSQTAPQEDRFDLDFDLDKESRIC
jgi:hypothetical protein